MTCSRQRCHRRVQALDLCKTHLDQDADRIFRRIVRERDGYCTAAEFFPHFACIGGLQGMHLISVTYRALRWDFENAAAGCLGHHKYLTEHPLEHNIFCERWLGTERWQALRDRRFGEPMRPEDFLALVA